MLFVGFFVCLFSADMKCQNKQEVDSKKWWLKTFGSENNIKTTLGSFLNNESSLSISLSLSLYIYIYIQQQQQQK